MTKELLAEMIFRAVTEKTVHAPSFEYYGDIKDCKEFSYFRNFSFPTEWLFAMKKREIYELEPYVKDYINEQAKKHGYRVLLLSINAKHLTDPHSFIRPQKVFRCTGQVTFEKIESEVHHE